MAARTVSEAPQTLKDAFYCGGLCHRLDRPLVSVPATLQERAARALFDKCSVLAVPLKARIEGRRVWLRHASIPTSELSESEWGFIEAGLSVEARALGGFTVLGDEPGLFVVGAL